MQVGIDEVGRGCLAGPLVVGAVSLITPIRGIRDSKKLTPSIRLNLAEMIYLNTYNASLGWVWPHEIDDLGLTAATALAMHRALSQIQGRIDDIIIDGNYNFLGLSNVTTLIKADDIVPNVSAASIIAKVARDNYMKNISNYFVGYDFHQHVGYCTSRHMRAIDRLGPSVIHRISFRPLNSLQKID